MKHHDLIIAVKCVHPLQLLATDSNLRADVDSDPALVGANASFTCPNGRLLIGPSKANCVGNGHWELDPREIECKGKYDSNICKVPTCYGTLMFIQYNHVTRHRLKVYT